MRLVGRGDNRRITELVGRLLVPKHSVFFESSLGTLTLPAMKTKWEWPRRALRRTEPGSTNQSKIAARWRALLPPINERP